jgi:CRISPR/Cas system-associated exonuclease Cas4 (RecB family)
MQTNSEELFLKRIAQELIDKHGKDLHRVLVVLPSNRSKVFLKKFLFEILGSAFLTPQLVLLPQFVKSVVKERTEEKLSLLLLLYRAYTEVVESPDSFEVFMKWGSMALDDFNDIDVALANPGEVFKNLKDVKDIENWSFGVQPLTDAQEDYADFWLDLGRVYHHFVELQNEQHAYSYARLNRAMAEEKVEVNFPPNADSVYFVGITAFSKAEEKWIMRLHKTGKVFFHFDADAYYVNNPIHEAGIFFRSWEERRMPIAKSDDFNTRSRTITFSKVVTPLASAFAASKLVNEMKEEDRANTAVVLVQPFLLRPFLNGLSIDSPVNVALGYPIDQVSLFRVVRMILRMWSRLSKEVKKGMYYKDFSQWILQTDLDVLLSSSQRREIQRYVMRRKFIYIREKELKELVQELPAMEVLQDLLTTENFNLPNCISRLKNFLSVYVESDHTDELTKETALRLQQILGRIEMHMEANAFLNEVPLLDLLFQHYASQETIAFQGEPLEGLQVLSMVETRAVDFKHVIIVGANDEQFPGNGRAQSLIPFDLRKAFELPSPEEREGTIAYSFYRLLQRAEDVRMLYHTLSSDYKMTEPSRYLLQIEQELTGYGNRTFVRYEDFEHSNKFLQTGEEEIVANEFSTKRIHDLLEYGISPSAINKFMRCPLDFYYRYVIGLGEVESLEENMEASTFGSIVHDVLETLYKRYVGMTMQDEDFNGFKLELDTLIDEAIHRLYNSNFELAGFDIIMRRIVQRMIEVVLEHDQLKFSEARANGEERIVNGVEVELKAELPMDKIGVNLPASVRGKADRVDEQNGNFMVLDYKTGSVKSDELKLSDKEGPWLKDTKPKLLQILTYSYMWVKDGHAPEHTQAMLFGLKQAKQGPVPLMRGQDPAVLREADIEKFEEELLGVLKSLLETEVFRHNPESEYCEFCK